MVVIADCATELGDTGFAVARMDVARFDGTTGMGSDECDARPEPVTGNVRLHCGHAATFPSNSSGTTSSLPHLGQRSVSGISSDCLHPQPKEEVVQCEWSQDNQHGGCHHQDSGQQHLDACFPGDRLGSLRPLDAEQIGLRAKDV